MAYQGCNACTAAGKVFAKTNMELLKESIIFKSQNFLVDNLTKNVLYHPKHCRANERTSESPASLENSNRATANFQLQCQIIGYDARGRKQLLNYKILGCASIRISLFPLYKKNLQLNVLLPLPQQNCYSK